MDHKTIALSCVRELAINEACWRRHINGMDVAFYNKKHALMSLCGRINGMDEIEQVFAICDWPVPVGDWPVVMEAVAERLASDEALMNRCNMSEYEVAERYFRTYRILREAHIVMGREVQGPRFSLLKPEILLDAIWPGTYQAQT